MHNGERAYGAFMRNGYIEHREQCHLSKDMDNAIERCFRHLALGRRNRLQCGSHEAAEHTALMYSLVESCNMNKIDFGDYIEHVLREIMDGNDDYRSLLPNHINMPQKETEKKVD